MTTVALDHPLRTHVLGYLSRIAIPADLKVARPEDEGAIAVRWMVRGPEDSGLAASYADADDVIEFGLLSREYGEPLNVLHVSLALDEGDGGSLHVTSAVHETLNVSTPIVSSNVRVLNVALQAFIAAHGGEVLADGSSALQMASDFSESLR